ncbi:MAG: hypothetical protein RL693_2 [Verrucomicrobiota bacterium]
MRIYISLNAKAVQRPRKGTRSKLHFYPKGVGHGGNREC